MINQFTLSTMVMHNFIWGMNDPKLIENNDKYHPGFYFKYTIFAILYLTTMTKVSNYRSSKDRKQRATHGCLFVKLLQGVHKLKMLLFLF